MKKEIYILIGLVAIFSLVPVLSAKAGTLTEASTTPANTYVANAGTYAVSFKVASSTEIKAQIRLIFPDGFNVSATANATSSITVSSTLAAAIVASSTVSGQEITLWLDDGVIAVLNDTLHFSGIPNIVNPTPSGSYTLGIETRTLANELSDDASSTAFSILGVSAPKSNVDTSPPTSTITSPTAGATISAGKQYVIEGTGTDAGNSTIEKVEVSLDDGKTWSTAQSNAIRGDFSWKYVWQNPLAGEYVIQVRATDSRGNMESPSAGKKVTVSAAESAVVPPSVSPEKPIAEMTVPELEAKIAEVQQKIVDLLQQLIQLLQGEIQKILAK